MESEYRISSSESNICFQGFQKSNGLTSRLMMKITDQEWNKNTKVSRMAYPVIDGFK